MLCAIDGFISIKLVPHIYKQEIYAGKPKKSLDSENNIIEVDEKMKVNYSPVNFFQFDTTLYPNLSEVDARYTVVLRSGDCMYIPAYYFH
jgi:Cupin-like domain